MSPADVIRFLRSEVSSDYGGHVLWRSSKGWTYVLSPPGADRHYLREGWRRLETVSALRQAAATGGELGPLLLLLKVDAELDAEKGRNSPADPEELEGA